MAKTKHKFPCSFKNVTLKPSGATFPMVVTRAVLDLDRADELFNQTILAAKMTALQRKESGEQKTLSDDLGPPSFKTEFACHGFQVKGEMIKFSLSAPTQGLQEHEILDLWRFCGKDGVLEISGYERADPEEEEDEEADEDEADDDSDDDA